MTGAELDALEPRDLEYRCPELPKKACPKLLCSHQGLTASAVAPVLLHVDEDHHSLHGKTLCQEDSG